MLPGQTAQTRKDIQCLLSRLPECIDLDFDEKNDALYQTNRGEVPFGNSLYRAKLDKTGKIVSQHEIIAQNFDEDIGIKLDTKNNSIYVTDFGGSVQIYKLDGSEKKRIYKKETASFTGLTIVSHQI